MAGRLNGKDNTMIPLTLRQAIRNAIEAEEGAGRFYRALAGRSADPQVREFCTKMALQEDEHAEHVEAFGKTLEDRPIPREADEDTITETVPDWTLDEDASLEDVLKHAYRAEDRVRAYYALLAEALDGDAGDFFRKLAHVEALHVQEVAHALERFRSEENS